LAKGKRPVSRRRGVYVIAAWTVWLNASCASQQREVEDANPVDLTISKSADIATLIVVFAVEPENQEMLIQVLKDGIKTVMSERAGCIAATFLKSKDGRRVISYAQWRSVKDVEAGPDRSDPEVEEYFQRVKTLAHFEPLLCDVAYVHHI